MATNCLKCSSLLASSFVVAILLLARVCPADVVPQSELYPEPTFEPAILPDPVNVPGKEYSNDVDKNAAGNTDRGQVIHWAGDGTNIWDSFDYHKQGGISGDGLPFQTDALANIRDKYFLDLDGTRQAVRNPYDPQDTTDYHDTVSLALSLQKSPLGPNNGYQNNIYAARSAFRGGGHELWADWHTNVNKNLTVNDDLDGLEMWGPTYADDANMYSLQDDLDPGDGQGRVSVYRFYPNPSTQPEIAGVSVPYLRTNVLLGAVIKQGGGTVTWGGANDPNKFDLDGLMVWDVADDNQFGPGDQIIFSVRPIDGLFDGGEIWLYKFNAPQATFLTQGLNDDGSPRVWDTNNEVSKFLFGDNLHGENIDALEALAPEPSTLVLLATAAVAFVCWRRRR